MTIRWAKSDFVGQPHERVDRKFVYSDMAVLFW